MNNVHDDHHMVTYRGLMWCIKCGAINKYLMRKRAVLKQLAKVCCPPTECGEANRRRLAREPPQLPCGYSSWPEDEMLEDAELRPPSFRLEVEA